MRKLFLLIATVWFSGCFAQGEFLNKSNSLPSNSGIMLPKTSKPSVLSPSTAFPSISKSKIEEKPLQFSQHRDFVNPGQPMQEKLNQRESDFNPEFVNKNQNFGRYTTKSDYVRICYRDYGALDGDVVRIYTADMMLVANAILDYDCHFMKLNLLKGENTINFQALNEGSSYPNTGELQIYDENGQLITSNRWGLESGFKGVVTIYKE